MPFIVLDPATAVPAPVLTDGAPLIGVGETLASMEQELTLQLGGRDDVDSPRLRRFINWGYVELAVSLKIDELRSSFGLMTAVGQPLYSVPRQVFSTIEVAMTDASHPLGGWTLKKTDLSSYRKARAVSDLPEFFFRQGHLLVLWPTPSEAREIAVDFWLRPDFMTADNHSPLLGLEWHELVVLVAKEKAFDALMEPMLAQNARNQWLAIVRRRRESGQDEQDGKPAGFFPVTSAHQLGGRMQTRFDPDRC